MRHEGWGDSMSDLKVRNSQAVAKYCHGCGKELHVSAESCPNCGAVQQVPDRTPARASSGKSRISAALFAFFLGAFGAHKFYLGQPGLGVLYLLFFWTFIPGIIAFIEFIMFLAMSDEAFAEKYG